MEEFNSLEKYHLKNTHLDDHQKAIIESLFQVPSGINEFIFILLLVIFGTNDWVNFYIIAGVFVFFSFIKLLTKKKFSEEYSSFYIITLGLIINFFPFIPGGNFFNNWISIILYYNIGFYLYSYKRVLL